MSSAIEVVTTTETKIDWWELGRMYANDADNSEQALFLHGAAVGFYRMPSGAMQLHYIREAIAELGEDNAKEVRELLDSLNVEVSP